RREEILERAVAGIVPVELLVGALEEPALAEQAPFVLRREGDVNRGGLAQAGKLDEPRRQARPYAVGAWSRRREKPAPGRRRERHRHLKLRIVTAARVLVGLRPAGIEHVFAARMGFEVARRNAEDGAIDGLRHKVLRLPTGARDGR